MKKFFLVVASFLFMMFVYFIVSYNLELPKIQHEIYLKNAKSLHKMFQNQVEQNQGKTASITYLLSKTPSVVEALKQKNAKLIDFSETIQGIENYGKYKNLWIQVIDADGFSFYRSWTDNVGDSVSQIRVDVAEMIQNPKPMYNISTGRFDMTFKTILPLYDNEKFIGMIELISHFDDIAQIFQDKEIEPLFVVDESYTPKFFKPLTGLFIGNNYVANANASKTLMKQIENEGISKFLDIDEYLLFEEYLVTTYQIRNIKNGPMGYFILFHKTKNIDMTALEEFKVTNLKRFIVVMTIFGLLVLLYINRNFVKTLNQEVQYKTAKIRRQKENLTRMLNIYDQHVIFSKTDPRGVITHASEAFCKVSGYTKEELIGKPHNIIRHPDMPKESFAYLWGELQKGNSVKLEVKNLKKDGGYYWVDADIGPEYDKDGNLVGYIAVRDEITANKDIEEIQREIIFTMGSIGESRSLETGNHVKRVAEYSYLLAILYGIPKRKRRS